MEPIRLYQEENSSLETVSNEICSICWDNLHNNTEIHHIRECNHNFHSSCLITWLRNNTYSNCPMCRGVSTNLIRQRSGGNILRHILSFCKSKKNTSKKLKKIYLKYEKIRNEFNLSRKKYKEFKTQHKDILKENNKLRMTKWRTDHKFYSIKREISSLPIEAINKK